MMKNEPLQKVVVVGGGSAGWMAAAALARNFGKRLQVELVESDAIGTVGVGEATIPQIKLFNQMLGIDEAEFLRETNGSIKLGIQFENWGKRGDSYLHAFGGIGIDVGGLNFHHYWLRAQELGFGGSLWDYSLNAAAATQNRFAPLEKVGSSRLEGLAYAYHFDASLFARFLRRYCESRGVTRREGKISHARLCPDTGSIESVVLDGGAEVSGDLFIDCSGFRALLIGEALEIEFESWSQWLPCDTALAVPTSSGPELEPFTRSIAHTAGWQWHIPLQHRTGNGHVYASSFLSDDAAEQLLREHLRGEPLAEPRKISFQTGRRKKFWHRNCIALGLASGFLEPLESTAIYLVQYGIGQLLQLFPDRAFCAADIEQYNRQMTREMELIRDFIILHYCVTGRDDSEFWSYCRNMALPERLREKIDLFCSRGRIFRESDELFAEVSWLQVMLGQGLVPDGYHPLALQLSDLQLREYLTNVSDLVRSASRKLPAQIDYLQRAGAVSLAPR